MASLPLRRRASSDALIALAVVASAALRLAGDVVINELMYHPPDERDDLQYVELFNRGSNVVDLSGWAFRQGFKFTFPPGTTLPPGGFVVVCRNQAAFARHYGSGVHAVGDAAGRLKHGGERLELADARGVVVEAFTYDDREPWPRAPDGGSASLERICPHAPAEAPDNWAPSRLPEMRQAAGTPGRQNDAFCPRPLPAFTEPVFAPPPAGHPAPIQVSLHGAEDVASVSLLYTVIGERADASETELAMQRDTGDGHRAVYRATLPAQPPDRLVRFRFKARTARGLIRFHPHENELRPTFSYYVVGATNTAKIPFVHLLQLGPPERPGSSLHWRPPRRLSDAAGVPARGTAACVYLPPGGGLAQTFDHIRLTPREGGWKVRLPKDRLLDGMSTINVIFERPRFALAEHLAYELYRKAGVPTPQSGFFRVWFNHRPIGYHLFVEQPNRSFLRRLGRDEDGNLYKLLWYGQGLVGQHEKKTNLGTGHEDLRAIVDRLQGTSGAEQWRVIQEHFNVENFASYYAACMCLQNWDGFFNNYFVYHDLRPGGKWEIFPWDNDKTWGDYDGASPQKDWYSMPLTMGMNGDQPPRDLRSLFQQGPYGPSAWWRPPGYFSGPLLANAEFRRRFLARLRELCETAFTEHGLLPEIIVLGRHLRPEVEFRARAAGRNPQPALQEFDADMESFRRQLVQRREFILKELAKAP